MKFRPFPIKTQLRPFSEEKCSDKKMKIFSLSQELNGIGQKNECRDRATKKAICFVNRRKNHQTFVPYEIGYYFAWYLCLSFTILFFQQS
jgi:hypothetical protein